MKPMQGRIHLAAALTVVLATAAMAQDAQVRVEVRDQNGVRVEVQGDGQAQMQLQVRVGPDVRQPMPASRPVDVKPTVTLTQERPGALAHFAFALPEKTDGSLAGPVTVKTDFGEALVEEGSLTPTACRFTWDVAAVRKEAPALRGAELRIEWELAPKGNPDAATSSYVTLALVRISPEGALTISEVNTSPVLPPQAFLPINVAMGISRSSTANRDVSFTLTKKAGDPTTAMTLALKNSHQFTKQPEVKVTIGSIGERAKWDPNAASNTETVTWSPPKDLPKEAAAGTVTWTFTSKAPATGEERSGTVTVKVTLSPAGALSLGALQSEFKVTKPGKPAVAQEDAAEQ